ncbi:hypothetical protein FACS189491_10420 [Spirochaetia bacterium]|nr:hypothetical protein FACS189491_10420 [Spirochaetia bacterium]
MASTIGIKIANGEFYSIMEENSVAKKRLVLTTAHDNQHSVQIDLYKSMAKTMADALYIGSVVVENIKSMLKGEPSVEMVISSNTEGEITADAIDLDGSADREHQILTVSLKSFEEETQEYEIPDFEMEQHEGPPPGLYEQVKDKERKGFPVLVLIIGVVIILACLTLWFFLFRGKGASGEEPQPMALAAISEQQEPTPPVPAEPPAESTVPAAPVPAVMVTPAVTAVTPPPTVARKPPLAPVFGYKVPDSIPKDGVPYKIRWGDTLWDISDVFYRDPWQYRRIARFNNIRNPNLIVSGTIIRVPPGN